VRSRPLYGRCLVTSAALILGLAFVALSASQGTETKMFATALAAGIPLDATIVRGMLVPATVAILGRWNWWLPQRLAPHTSRALASTTREDIR